MSLRLRLLNGVLRWAVKPRLAATKTPAQAEREFDRGARIVFRVPRGVRVAVRHVPGPARPVRVNRIAGRGAADDGLILHFHGGGYVAGSAQTHLGMLARLSSSAGVPVDAPDYRLAGEAPAPAAFEDACAVWDALIRDGKEPARIVLGGDSAGGGIALALLAWLCARGTPPAGLYAFSPWADLTLSAVSLAENAVADPLLPGGRLGELVAVICGRLPAEDPRVSPLSPRSRARRRCCFRRGGPRSCATTRCAWPRGFGQRERRFGSGSGRTPRTWCRSSAAGCPKRGRGARRRRPSCGSGFRRWRRRGGS